jgi:hypothetical protein
MRTNTAQEAIELAEALARSDEEIQFIDTPTDGRVGIDMLRVLAKEEAGRSLAVQAGSPSYVQCTLTRDQLREARHDRGAAMVGVGAALMSQ